MDNSIVYEEIMMTKYFNKMKYYRNAWDEEMGTINTSPFLDIEGEEYRTYDFIMKQTRSITLDMIYELVMTLMDKYNIQFKRYNIYRNSAYVYSMDRNTNWNEYIEQSNKQQIFAFSCKNSNILYLFKDYGIGNIIPQSLIERIIKDNRLKKYCYITLKDDLAVNEILNSTINESITMKQLFDLLFDEEEYSIFKTYADKFKHKVREYYGFHIVKSLKINEIQYFRRTLKNNLQDNDITNEIGNSIATEQLSIIKKNYFNNGNYKLLLGSSDFAQSFVTAEWMFSSLEGAENIDFTPIVMGYLKSVEQLLMQIITLQTNKNNKSTRKIYLIGNRQQQSGYYELTKELLENKINYNRITLNSLVRFFGYLDYKNKQYDLYNKDLLDQGIDENTHEYIIYTLNRVVKSRNGYFHRHNLKNWDKVKEVRKLAKLVYFLMLGAYELNENDKKELGLVDELVYDDYYKLCRYCNEKAYDHGIEIPIVYLNGESNPQDFYIICQDNNIEYDSYGTPIYSGVFYKRLNSLEPIQINKDNIPSEISEGILKIDPHIPIENWPSGPLKTIYSEGKFWG